MEKIIRKQPIQSCIIIFAVCGFARLIEYFLIKTDETILSENFLHKVFGIIILAIILHLLHNKRNAAFGIVKGFALGGCCFFVAYFIECLLLYHINRNVSLSFYISGFSLNNETAKYSGILFLFFCIVFNLINVWMEEGLFRGLFMSILIKRQSFFRATFFIAWVMPLRDYINGDASLANLLVMGIGYIILAGMMSIKWSLLYNITGSLWMGLGDHLFNNVIVTNLLHVISNNEADSLQIVRIMIGQMLSFVVVVMLYYRKKLKS